MRKVQWFPETKYVTLVIYIFFFAGFAVVVISAAFYGRNVVYIGLGYLAIMFVALTVTDKKLYPLFMKVNKKHIKIYYYFFNHKKMKRCAVKISFTEIADLFETQPIKDRIELDPKRDIMPGSYFAFVLYSDIKFTDKCYLQKDLGTAVKKQIYVDYSWNTLRNKKFIVIDGSYKNYKYLRQFFGVDKFCDTRGIEKNKIAEYEEKLRQETLTESI